jgi:hypothetical protein
VVVVLVVILLVRDGGLVGKTMIACRVPAHTLTGRPGRRRPTHHHARADARAANSVVARTR